MSTSSVSYDYLPECIFHAHVRHPDGGASPFWRAWLKSREERALPGCALARALGGWGLAQPLRIVHCSTAVQPYNE